ncbi:hypothetical protein B0H11DRAFT_720950 [Mycena galericulata]|nr:hypothetical protein B0H11DRAFT_720950 [Mycena galericulata]
MLSISVEKTQIISQACEALCYGFLMCTFSVSFYIHFNISRRTTQLKVLVAIACAMFVIATGHFVITFYRTLKAMEDLTPSEGGAEAFLGDSAAWHLITADLLFVTQCILGDSIAIYRCWILWDRDWRVITPSLILLAAIIVSGYICCQKLATTSATRLFDPLLRDWILAFYTVSVAHNTVTTSLIAFRLWWVDRYISDRVSHPRLITTILLLVESAAIYLILQVMVLSAFIARSNVQFLFLGSIPPVIGITFTLITIRIGLRSRYRAYLDPTMTQAGPSTIGSITMRCNSFAFSETVTLDEEGQMSVDIGLSTPNDHGGENELAEGHPHNDKCPA